MSTNRTWVILRDQALYIRNWDKFYKITNDPMIRLFKNKVPILSERPASLEEMSATSTDSKLLAVLDQMNHIFAKQVRPPSQLDRSILFVVPETNSASGVCWTLAERYGYEVATVKRNSDVPDNLYVIYVLLSGNHECLPNSADRGDERQIRLIRSLELGLLLFIGSVADYQVVEACFPQASCEMGEIRNEDLDAAVSKIISLADGDLTDNPHLYLINSEAAVSIQRLEWITTELEHGETEYRSIESVEIPPADSYHAAIFCLERFANQVPYYIDYYGLGEHRQVPLKLGEFSLHIQNRRIGVYIGGSTPQEAYIEAFKAGIPYILEGLEPECNSLHQWVAAQSRQDILQNGVLPIVFKLIEQGERDRVIRTKMKVADLDHVLVRIMKRIYQDDRIEQFELRIHRIADTSMMMVMIYDRKRRNSVYSCYSCVIDQAVQKCLIQLYSLVFQNPGIYVEGCDAADPEIELQWYEDVCDLSRLVPLASSGDKWMDMLNNLVKKMGFRVVIGEWRFNLLLKDAGIKCFKVKLQMEENYGHLYSG
ncbi:hypothetical protein DNH61_25215 [Paenibacillus sambharensis]|uniref:Uncharacterized protein n=1 Tax=Paenibacillus sambharensis TaxID=1803190 RepID=A0A2W1LDD9_9BACL|nr:hypothetical protein [Paenibacillus sambharensis]PZD93082.1 hypothetical protein DNH61_25215 [Paenibacillus sambharensis]